MTDHVRDGYTRLGRDGGIKAALPYCDIPVQSALPALWKFMPFRASGLESRILKAVQEAGYTEPTPIQSAAIPHILSRLNFLVLDEAERMLDTGFLPDIRRTV